MTDAKEAGGAGQPWKFCLIRLTFINILAILVIIIILIVLIIWLILHPTNPHFTLNDVTVNAFNICTSTTTTITTVTSSLQFTISSRNPNARIGIFYDKLEVFATYRSQQITLPTTLPTSYQSHKDVTVWSPYVHGAEVPVAPYLAESLLQDENAGTVLVNVKAAGKVRWKVGTYVSGVYRLNVNCPAYITFGNNKNGGYVVNVGPVVKYQVTEGCIVDV